MNLTHNLVLPVLDILVIIASTIGLACLAKLAGIALEYAEEAWLDRRDRKAYDASRNGVGGDTGWIGDHYVRGNRVMPTPPNGAAEKF
jgi:hypothetical protein